MEQKHNMSLWYHNYHICYIYFGLKSTPASFQNVWIYNIISIWFWEIWVKESHYNVYIDVSIIVLWSHYDDILLLRAAYKKKLEWNKSHIVGMNEKE